MDVASFIAVIVTSFVLIFIYYVHICGIHVHVHVYLAHNSVKVLYRDLIVQTCLFEYFSCLTMYVLKDDVFQSVTQAYSG